MDHLLSSDGPMIRRGPAPSQVEFARPSQTPVPEAKFVVFACEKTYIQASIGFSLLRIAMSKSATPRIFVTLAAPTLAAMESQASGVWGSQIGYELRLDYLQRWENFEHELREILARLRAPHAIATCRRTEAGGLFSGSVSEQVERLEAAARAGCHRVDIEIESV